MKSGDVYYVSGQYGICIAKLETNVSLYGPQEYAKQFLSNVNNAHR
jgi:hypothetical protein